MTPGANLCHHFSADRRHSAAADATTKSMNDQQHTDPDAAILADLTSCATDTAGEIKYEDPVFRHFYDLTRANEHYKIANAEVRGRYDAVLASFTHQSTILAMFKHLAGRLCGHRGLLSHQEVQFTRTMAYLLLDPDGTPPAWAQEYIGAASAALEEAFASLGGAAPQPQPTTPATGEPH